MKGIVDRFEGEIAVIEIAGVMQDIPRRDMGLHVQQGDAVELIHGIWETNEVDTGSRKKKVKELMDKVWEE